MIPAQDNGKVEMVVEEQEVFGHLIVLELAQLIRLVLILHQQNQIHHYMLKVMQPLLEILM